MRRRHILPFLLWLSLPAQTPDLKTGTQLVIVDVSVSDAAGNPVRGLKQSEFSVSENGASQTISHFEESSSANRTAALPAVPKLEPNVYTNFSFASDDAPIDVLLIDTLNTPTLDQAKTRQELVAFVQGMRPDARVAVFALNTRLMLLQGVTSDRKLLLAALENNKLFAPSPLANDSITEESMGDVLIRSAPPAANAGVGVLRNEAAMAVDRNEDRAESTVAAFNQLARYLSGISGRKNLIWLSGSFPIDPAGSGSGVQTSLRETMNLLARSRVAVYPIDSRQMGVAPLEDVSSTKYVGDRNAALGDTSTYRGNLRNEHSTMEKIAQATGGKAFTDENGIGRLAAKITEEGGNFYTLTYSPTNKAEDGRYRKIHVQLASGNYTLSYRDGYYAGAPATKKGAAAEPTVNAMRLAMQRGAPEPTEILFKAILVAGSAPTNKLAEGNKVIQKTSPPYRLVTIAYAVNPGDVAMPLQADGTRQVALEFVALVFDRDGRLYTQQMSPVNVFAKPEGYQQFLHEGMRYQQQIAVPAKGEYYVRVGVHDRLSDKVGAIEVPSTSIGTQAN